MLCCLFICFCFDSADRQSGIGDRKLESWTLGNYEDVCFFSCSVFMLFDYDVYDFVVFTQQCDAVSKLLHAFDKILIF